MRHITLMICASAAMAGVAYGASVTWTNTTIGLLEDHANWSATPPPDAPPVVAPAAPEPDPLSDLPPEPTPPEPDVSEYPEGYEGWEPEDLATWITQWKEAWLTNWYDTEIAQWKTDWTQNWWYDWDTNHAADYAANWATNWIPWAADSVIFAPANEDIVVQTHAGMMNYNAIVSGGRTVTFEFDAGAVYSTYDNFMVGGGTRLVVGDGATLMAMGVPTFWTAVRSIIVGEASSGNEILVTTGGTVKNSQLFLGPYGGSNNRFIVEGSGKFQTAGVYRDVEIGLGGTDNLFLVRDGGHVEVTAGASTFNLGYGGHRNRLVVSNATFICYYGRGENAVGDVGGTDNTLEVYDGGSATFQLAQGLPFGKGGGSGNGIIVSGTNDLTGARSTLVVYNGIFLASSCNPSFASISDGGELHVYGNILFGGGTVSNGVHVTGSGSLLKTSDGPWLGVSGGSDNEYRIEDGGGVVAEYGYGGGNNYQPFTLGQGGGSRNRMVIEGKGSYFYSTYSWYPAGPSRIGNGGADNELVVDGGSFHGVGDYVVGHGAGSMRNLFHVKNGGTAQISISVHGHRSVNIGGTEGADGNVIRVEGEGSSMSASLSPIVIGGASIQNVLSAGGAENRLEIVDGGTVSSATDAVYVGIYGGAGCSNNVVCVSNGTFNVMGAYGLIAAAQSRIEIAGTNSALNIGSLLHLTDSSVLHYTLDKGVVTDRPLIKTGFGGTGQAFYYGDSTWFDVDFIGDGTGILEIDALQCAVAGGGKVILMETTRPSLTTGIASGALMALNDLANPADPARVRWLNDVVGRLEIEPNGNGGSLLACYVPNRAGTMILLR